MITPEERIARLEERVSGQQEWLKSIDDKVDQLLAAANMGKGAWVLLLKLGGALVVLVGVVTAVIQAIAWVFDRIPFHK